LDEGLWTHLPNYRCSVFKCQRHSVCPAVTFAAMDTPDQNTYGWRIRRLRKTAKLTQEQLAARMGVSQSVVSDMERNKYGRPSYELAAQFAQALTSTPDYILDGLTTEDRSVTLTDKEKHLIRTYRLLDAKDQSRLLQNADTYLSVPGENSPAEHKTKV
jgi:transcriptional regulator with XRE-family HTH domain